MHLALENDYDAAVETGIYLLFAKPVVMLGRKATGLREMR